MRQRHTPFILHPALLVALAVTLGGVSAGDPSVAAAARAPERVVEATGGRDAVAVLLSCLEDAAKDLQQQGRKAASIASRSGVWVAAAPVGHEAPTAPAAAPPPSRTVALHHLNLPPPCRAA